MNKQTFRSLGLDVAFQVPASVEEFDLNAKKDGACLSEAINNVIYRGSLATFRDVFIHGQDADPANNIPAIEGLEAKSGIERKTKPTGKVDKDKNPILVYAETEADYVQRVCAEKGVEITAYQSLANEVAESIAFDASATERKASGPKKLPKMYAETAAKVIANGNEAKVLAKLKNESNTIVELVSVPDGSTDEEVKAITAKNIDLLGWGIKANEDAKRKDAAAEYVA